MDAIKRDIYVLEDRLKETIQYVQGTNTLPIIFTFRDFNIPQGAKVRVYVKKPSQKDRFENVTQKDGNTVTVNVEAQMVAEVGIANMQLEVTEANKVLATFIQPISVKASGMPIKSESGSAFIEELLEDVRVATERANQTMDEIEQKAQSGAYTATIDVGLTTTIPPDQVAVIRNVGTKQKAVFDFEIPKGDPGKNAIVIVAKGDVAFQVLDSNLLVHYEDTDNPPNYRIDENGHLVKDIGGTI